MDELWKHMILAFALIFVIEGLFYAIFPSYIQRMMRKATEIPPDTLRSFGAAMAATGIMAIWIIQKF